MDTDNRGVKRGSCKNCTGCGGFKCQPSRPACANCGCAPAKHLKIGVTAQGIGASGLPDSEVSTLSDKCLVCCKAVYFDVNTGDLFKYCESHLQQQPSLDVATGSGGEDDMTGVGRHNGASASTYSQQGTCAIEECSKPCHVDASGFVHKCCGYSHAMEYIRRQTVMKQVNKIKGVSHCLLPDCTRVTWPFMNYCGRTHAQLGKEMGLVPPTGHGIARPKDSSMCELPGCFRNKYVDESGKTLDFCGKKHAAALRGKGVVLKQAIGDEAIAKDDTMCIIPECAKLKFKDPITGEEHNYCGRRHAEEAKRRGIKPPPPPLKSISDVKDFLGSFTNLKVADIKENEHAKPGGVLYNKFIAAKNALPQGDQNTCLAFHGTAAANIPSICKDGYDPSKRKGQAYGKGEYFAATPDLPMSYCDEGKQMLLNELLLGQDGVHHTKSGDIIVMKNPEHDLPRFVITFQKQLATGS